MKKSIFLLSGILILFVVFYLLLIQKEKKTFAPGKVENFLDLDSASVSRIEFKKFGTKLIFQKVNQQWYVIEPDSCRADNNAIGQLLSLSSHLEVGEVISSNPEKQFFFQVDTLTGTHLFFFTGNNPLTSLVVGKMSSDFLNTFVRKTDSEDVYLARSFLGHMVNRPLDQWKDRTAFAFDPKQVKGIELSQGKEKFKLAREDTLWQLSLYPYQEISLAEGRLVDDYLQSLANLKADGIARKSELAEIDFEKSEFILTLTLLDGHEEKLLIVQKEKEPNRYFLKTSQGVHILFEHNFKRLAKKPGDFQPQKKT